MIVYKMIPTYAIFVSFTNFTTFSSSPFSRVIVFIASHCSQFAPKSDIFQRAWRENSLFHRIGNTDLRLSMEYSLHFKGFIASDIHVDTDSIGHKMMFSGVLGTYYSYIAVAYSIV
jgi:hypothetical protein